MTYVLSWVSFSSMAPRILHRSVTMRSIYLRVCWSHRVCNIIFVYGWTSIVWNGKYCSAVWGIDALNLELFVELIAYIISQQALCMMFWCKSFVGEETNYPYYFRVFFLGGLGVPPSGKNFANPPPSDTPPPAEVRPRKFEKFKYIFVSNLTTFKLKSTLKSCISWLK